MEQTTHNKRRGVASNTSGSIGTANSSRATAVSSTSSCQAPRLDTNTPTTLRLASSTASQTPTRGGDPLDGGSLLSSLQEWWTPGDLAAHLHLTPNAITYHCRRLFPDHPEGHRYRLSHADAVRVYNYVRKFGCKKEPNSAS